MTVWVVGRYVDETWELQGVYSSEKLARQHAQPNWFIGPVELDESLPEATTEWADAYITQISKTSPHGEEADPTT